MGTGPSLNVGPSRGLSLVPEVIPINSKESKQDLLAESSTDLHQDISIPNSNDTKQDVTTYFKDKNVSRRFYHKLLIRIRQISSLIASIDRLPIKSQSVSDSLDFLSNLSKESMSLYNTPSDPKAVKFILRTEFKPDIYFHQLTKGLPIDFSEIFPYAMEKSQLSTMTRMEELSNYFGLRFNHFRRTHSIAITNSCEFIVTAGDDRFIRIWSIKKQRQVREISVDTKSVTAMTLTPDNKYLATCSKNFRTAVWAFPSLSLVSNIFPDDHCKSKLLVSSWNSRYIITAYNSTISIWDLQNNELYTRFRGMSNITLSLAISRNDEFLASAGYERCIRVWNIKAKAAEYVLNGHLYNVKALVFSKDGRYLASAGGGKVINFWKLSERIEVCKIEGVKSCIFAMEFINNDKQLITAGDDCYFGLWELDKNDYHTIECKIASFTRAISVSSDGEYIAFTGRSSNIDVWSIKEDRIFMKMDTLHNPASIIGTSDDRRYAIIVSNSNVITSYRLKDKHKVSTLERDADKIISISAKSGMKYIVTAEKSLSYWVWATAVSK